MEKKAKKEIAMMEKKNAKEWQSKNVKMMMKMMRMKKTMRMIMVVKEVEIG